jgi:hypothetical protein
MAETASIRPPISRSVILLLALAMMPFGLALPRYLRAKRSTKWPVAQGVITVSRLQVGYVKRMKGYRGEIRYQYRVGSTDYNGSRLSFERVHLAVEDAWQKVIDDYPVGKTVNVYYDPEEPSFAVLEPGLIGELAPLYQTNLGFLVLFGAGLLIALYKFREPAIR